MHACPNAKGGIYVYVIKDLKDNPYTPAQISVHHIEQEEVLTLTRPNTLLQDFISQYDKQFVERILKLKSNFFETLNP